MNQPAASDDTQPGSDIPPTITAATSTSSTPEQEWIGQGHILIAEIKRPNFTGKVYSSRPVDRRDCDALWKAWCELGMPEFVEKLV
jgi:hypothetical protein